MFQNRHKLQCDDAQRHVNNDHEEPRRDIELCLEVEMDDEVRDIITSPEMCASTLLDVTVIKPKDIDQVYTAHKKTLNGEEVRKLITSMELEKDDQKKLLDRILGKDDAVVTIHRHGNLSKSAGDYSKNKHMPSSDKKKSANSPIHCLNSQESALFYEHLQKISSTDETVSEVLSNYQDNYRNLKSAGDQERVEQIYTTPRTYNDLKALFKCKNKNRYDHNDKLNKPCLCQNCAILGLLNDAQKKPFATEVCFDPREHKKAGSSDKPRRKKSVNFKEEIHTDCEYYFRYLSSKIKTLEERIAVQEEKSVSRDYFKKIVTKLVNHISKLTNTTPDTKPHKCKESHKPRDNKIYEDLGHRYYVHPVLIDQKFNQFVDEKKGHAKDDTATSTRLSSGMPPQVHYDSFWKWGEEILRPGIDLKNKIIDLLEETLHNLRRPKESISRMEGNIKHFVDEFSNKLYKTINEVPVRDGPPKKQEQNKSAYDPSHSHSSSSVSKKVDGTAKHLDKKTFKKIGSKLPQKGGPCEEPLNVSYLNPKVKGWHEESQISFKFESSDIESVKRVDDRNLNECYKQDFMDTLSHTKEADKMKLWQSIWNQAKTNGQSKQDKVTIQIPNRKDLKKNKVIEIEYTIAELETLLTGKAVAQKNDLGHKKK